MFLTRVLALLLLSAAAHGAHAAHLYLDPGSTVQNRMDTFYVPVRLDTQGECINAVSVSLSYDPREVSVRDIALGDSILTLWTARPVIGKEGTRETGTVSFEGGVPGGYCGRVEGDPGRTNVLATLVMTGTPQALDVDATTSTSIIIDPASSLYANDGVGSRVGLTLLGADLTLIQATGTPRNPWLADVEQDTIAPELFDIIFVEGPSVGHGKHYIVFSTVDKQSGIDHYEVLETDPDHFGFLTWVSRESHWVRAESPYVLRDQKLRSKIMVKAVDKRGNERVVTYTPPMSALDELTRPIVLVPLLAILAVLVLIVILIVHVRSKKRTIISHEADILVP